MPSQEENNLNRMFFGDTRDLFKCDLARHIMKAFRELAGAGFAFVPMLTEKAAVSGQRAARTMDLGLARKKERAGTRNRELMEDLGRLQETGDDLRYLKGIRFCFFKKECFMVDILHRDSFSHEHRVNYFEIVLENFPEKSLEFFDPDTGPEVKNPTQRLLMFEEVGQQFGRMGRQSILMICQHVPRVTGDRYIRKRCRELAALTHVRPDTITDNEIVFFLLTKNPRYRTRLCAVPEEYADRYPALTASGGDSTKKGPGSFYNPGSSFSRYSRSNL